MNGESEYLMEKPAVDAHLERFKTGWMKYFFIQRHDPHVRIYFPSKTWFRMCGRTVPSECAGRTPPRIDLGPPLPGWGHREHNFHFRVEYYF